VALSRDLADYLTQRVGIKSSRVEQLYTGVDTDRFAPAPGGRQAISGCPFGDASHWLVGTVGRMQTVKDQTLLARAFVGALARQPALRSRLRLVMVGDGPLRDQSLATLREAGVADLAWLPGERVDVPDVMRGLDCFVLPSKAEGISNTILEAMACGLPVVATDVGGNRELVDAGQTGALVPSGDVDALAATLVLLANDPASARVQGGAGRERVLECFSLQSMVASYQRVYHDVLTGSPAR
jgi:sugar transferase (PEP-CTERM/EpsH1 system associated)